MRQPAGPESMTQITGPRWPVLFSNLPGSPQYLLQIHLVAPVPSAQNPTHRYLVHKLMLFAECDRRVGLACDGRSFAAELMYPEAYCSRHCLAERMSRCIRITARVCTKPQRLIREPEETKCQPVVQSYVNARVLR